MKYVFNDDVLKNLLNRQRFVWFCPPKCFAKRLGAHNNHTLRFTVWHSKMKDILVLLCCIGLMVNNKFIFLTVCQSVYVCDLHFLLRHYGHLKFCASLQIEQGGITHLPQILCSLIVSGFAADLMRLEGFAAANFSIHPKEEEEVVHQGGRKKIR